MEGVGNCVGVWGEVREVCWGCGKRVGVWESMGRCGGWSRCVEVCLGCGEMCLGCGGKGVGVGALGQRVLGKGRWGVRGEGLCHDLGPQLF